MMIKTPQRKAELSGSLLCLTPWMANKTYGNETNAPIGKNGTGTLATNNEPVAKTASCTTKNRRAFLYG